MLSNAAPLKKRSLFRSQCFSHGTMCAGVALASMNTVCGVGSAYEASLAGIY